MLPPRVAASERENGRLLLTNGLVMSMHKVHPRVGPELIYGRFERRSRAEQHTHCDAFQLNVVAKQRQSEKTKPAKPEHVPVFSDYCRDLALESSVREHSQKCLLENRARPGVLKLARNPESRLI